MFKALGVMVLLAVMAQTYANDYVLVDCYDSNLYDLDHDGYAAIGAVATPISRPESKKKSCPAGYVYSTGDCNDLDSSVHPYRLEKAFNGKDDNCNNKTDETEYYYSSGGFNVGNTSFGLRAKVNSSTVTAAFYQNNLYAKIYYQKLRNSIDRETGYYKINSLSFEAIDGTVSARVALTLSGLDKTNVYRARVSFFKKVGTSYVQVQEAGNIWYYSTTNDTSSRTSKARTGMLLRAFNQYYDQLRGRVGQEGSVAPNGTRYGASFHELWCSEFYAWVGKEYLYFISGMSSTSMLAAYFGSNYHKNINTILDKWARADWLALDTNDDGKKNHTAMVLAYDDRLGKFWTIEGNTGNRVGIKTRELDSVYGLGHITKWKVKLW